jgi:hypothetical protein
MSDDFDIPADYRYVNWEALSATSARSQCMFLHDRAKVAAYLDAQAK